MDGTIDYPNGDYVGRFLRLAHRVPRVPGFLNLLQILQKCQLHPSVERRLLVATVTLVRKLATGAAFPLDVISTVAHGALHLRRAAEFHAAIALRAALDVALEESRFSTFRSLRAGVLFLNSSPMMTHSSAAWQPVCTDIESNSQLGDRMWYMTTFAHLQLVEIEA